MTKKQPTLAYEADKRQVRAQFAALCFKWQKKQKKTKVLLVSSRQTGRWIIPKGWPISGKTPSESALLEAFEEAGVRGVSYEQCIGHFSYSKNALDKTKISCVVAVFPVQVEKLLNSFPECDERKRMWLSPSKAAKEVSDNALKPILRNFDPRKINGLRA